MDELIVAYRSTAFILLSYDLNAGPGKQSIRNVRRIMRQKCVCKRSLS